MKGSPVRVRASAFASEQGKAWPAMSATSRARCPRGPQTGRGNDRNRERWAPARRINLHTRDKFDRHKKYCGIFNGGVRNRWQDNRGYLELFAGGGVAVEGTDDSTPAR